MPRDIPVGNGALLASFDRTYPLRDEDDVYYQASRDVHVGPGGVMAEQVHSGV